VVLAFDFDRKDKNMSQEGVKAVVTKILTDDEFQLTLFKDAKATITAGN
jgi:hypothetical protein